MNDRTGHKRLGPRPLLRLNTAAALLCAAIALGTATRALAQDLRPIVVVTSGDAGPWTAEIREAVAAELHAEAIAPGDAREKSARGTLTVSLSTANRDLLVRYRPTQGDEIVRRLRADGDRDRTVKTTALLAGNLVRDEAREILDAQKRPTQPAGAVDAAGNPIAPATGAASGNTANAGTPESVPKEGAPKPEEPAKKPVLLTPPAEATTPMAMQPRPCDAIQAKAPFHPLVGSLFYPLASNFRHPDVTTPFALNLIYGHVGQIRGADIGVASVVGCDVDGVQIQAAFAYAGRRVHGAQLALGLALARDGVTGAQLSDGLAVAKTIEGAQIGIVDVAGDVQGVQLGLANFAHRVEGPQLGLMTYAHDVQGLQLGLLNIGNDVNGAQIGVLNIGRHIKGTQIGVVNISEDVDGASIGTSISKSGYIRPFVWGSTSTYRNINVGVRFDMRWVYGQVSIGYVDGSNFNDWALSSSAGFHVLKPDEPGLLFDLEFGSQSLLGAKSEENDKSRGVFNVLAGWRVSRRLAFFGGMGIVYSQRKNDNFIGPDVVGGVLF